MKNHTHRQNNNIQEGNPKSRATYHHGSTVQGGSDFGQGSLQLGKKNYKQGSESDKGANYANERGWDNEALRRKSDVGPSANEPTVRSDEHVVPKRHK
jgi:hypothetical protein